MPWRIPACFFCVFLFSQLFLVSCGTKDDEPFGVSPSQFGVEGEQGESRVVPLALINGSENEKIFLLSTDSPRLAFERPEVMVPPRSRELVALRVSCPSEGENFEDQIEIKEKGSSRRRKIPIFLQCHPSIEGGEARLSLEIEGLPEEELAAVTLSGPDNTELFLTANLDETELPSGRYTLTASPVLFAGYELAPHEELVSFLLLPETRHTLKVSYSFREDAPRSELSLQIEAPLELRPSVRVSGPGGFEKSVTSPAELRDLKPGAYEIYAEPEVRTSSSGRRSRWVPSQERKTLFLVPGTTHIHSLSYSDHLEVTSSDDGEIGSLRQVMATAPAGATVFLPAAQQAYILDGGPIEIHSEIRLKAESGAQLTTYGASGAFIVYPEGLFTIEELEIFNSAHSSGPAITSQGYLVLEGVTLRGNERVDGPAAIFSSSNFDARRLRLSDNSSKSGAGAVMLQGATAEISKLWAHDNRGHRGAVFYVDEESELALEDAILSTNSAHEGGAIFSRGVLQVKRSAFSRNHTFGADSFGGAILSEGELLLTNVTLFGNKATFGSALAIDRGSASLSHCTLADSETESRVSPVFVGSEASLSLRATLVQAGVSPALSIDAMDGSELNSKGFNLILTPGFFPLTDDDLTNQDSDALTFLDALLSEGVIMALPLGEDHPGRGAVPPEGCLSAEGAPLLEDQLKVPRPIEGPCDLGAIQSTTTTLNPDFPE